MSHSPSIPDRPNLNLDPNMSKEERLGALLEHYSRIVHVNEELVERLETMEAQRQGLRARVEELQEENTVLKSSSLYIASVEEVLERQAVLKQHGNNQEILTEISASLAEDLEPGVRVAVNDSFSIQGILGRETDPRAQAMEVDESPDVSYADIGGLDDQIRDVRETVELPLKNPGVFDEVGVSPPSGVLLYGPPGTGKTMLAKAVANETDAAFIRMAGSELVHKFIGEGARLVRDLFGFAEELQPSIVFIDEIDAIASRRTDSKTSGDAEVQRTMMQLLALMDGFEDRGDVRIMAATNRSDMLDPAILRPGRFDRLIEVPKPEGEAREKIFELHTRGMNVSGEVDYRRLARETPGASGADIESICTEAGMLVIRDDRTKVTMTDFLEAAEKLMADGPSTVVASDGAARAFY